MWKKLASMIAGSILVSSCQTSMYKPIICEPGTALKDGRCQKVPQSLKDQYRTTQPAAEKTKPKYRSKKVTGVDDQGPSVQAPVFQSPRARQNVYGLPIN